MPRREDCVSTQRRPKWEGSRGDRRSLRVETDPVGERVLSQSVWNGVAGISPPTHHDKRD
jgi:hypothetical protein